MGWRGMLRSANASARQARLEADRDLRYAQRQDERRERQLHDLRMKALAEQAKGEPGVWTAEYEAEIAADRAAAEAAERARVAHAASVAASNKGCLQALGVLVGLMVIAMISAGALTSCATCMSQYEIDTGGAPTTHPVKKNPPTRGKK